MSDYSAVTPPQNFNNSSAFAAAVQRARQIAAKINPAASTGGDQGQKRPLDDNPDEYFSPDQPESKKPATASSPAALSAAAAQAQAVAARVAATAAAGIQGLGGLPLGPVTNEDIKVPDKMVGLSRGGEQISRLQAESGCKIQMAPDSGGLPERLCTLTGNDQSRMRAKELIGSIISSRSKTEGTGGARLDELNLGPAVNQNSAQSSHSQVEIMVPGPKVGLIIGKGGETIKQLQEKSGAKMVVVQDGPSQENEKPLRISGDPQKVEHAKQLVYELIAEKDMQNSSFDNSFGGGRNDFMNSFGNFENGSGSRSGENEVLVPQPAVGVVIGKGGEMIKKIQQETGAKVQFQQNREEGPGERRCILQGTPSQIEEARQRIEDLIESVMVRMRRDSEGGRGRGGRNDQRGGGRDRDRNSRDWDGRGGGDKQETTLSVPASKCGVIIGKGGETIRQINQQTGAHCEIDRRNQPNPNEKTFIIRGTPEQIERAKNVIAEKLGMPPGSFNGMGSAPNSGAMNGGPPTGYPIGGGPGGPQFNQGSWGAPGFPGQQQQQQQQPWQGGTGDQSSNSNVPVNPATGTPDYSQQWAMYYRSVGLIKEAEMVEMQAKHNKAAMGGSSDTPAAQPQQQVQQSSGFQSQNGQADYSVQWAEYYRSIGKIKEAEVIEAQIKAKQQAAAATAPVVSTQPAAAAPQPQMGAYGQPQYGMSYQPSFYSNPQAQQQPGPPQFPYSSYPNYPQADSS
ncbi:far upstream element-binding protein 1 isoform X2 [Bemisia tabaci]|uniref:far upstream element-binding protein 1 isoform X2 n=1 Tax=Bemisia tabaci TaxID=7038 RepID=UPI0008F9A105|nr:PREDICTED: far upstream element-binding protein 3 isoform X2 [Bemisia tabaci]